MLPPIKNISKHSAIYAIGNLISKGVGFFLIPLYTYQLTTADYGILEILDLTAQIIGMLLAMGIAQSVMRFYFEYDDESRDKVISTAIIVIWIISVPALIIFFFLSAELSNLVFNTPDYSNLFNLIFVTTIINLNIEVPFAYIRIHEKSIFYTVLSLVRLLITITLNIILLVYYKMGIAGILVSGVIASIVISIVLYIYILRNIRIVFSMEILTPMLKYGYPLIGSWIAMFVINFGDRFILQNLASLSDVGIYSLAYKFGMLPNLIILGPFMMIWAPKQFAIVKEKNAHNIFPTIFTYFTLIQIFFCLGIALLIKDTLAIIAAPEYRSAYQYVPIILLGYILFGAYQFVQFGILYRKKTSYLAISNLVVAIINILANMLLIPHYKIWGAAYATLLSFFLLFVISYILSQKLYYINFEKYRLAKLLLAASLCFTASIYIDTQSIMLSIFLNSIILLLFPIVLFFIRFYTLEELRKIKNGINIYLFRKQNS